MVMVNYIIMILDMIIMVISLKIVKVVKEKKLGVMVLIMKVIMKWEKKMVLGNINGKMGVFIMGNGKIIKYMVWEFTIGVMGEFTLVDGEIQN